MARVRAATPDDYGLFTRFFAAFDLAGPTPSREWWERSHGDALFVEQAERTVGYALAYRLGREHGHVAHVVVDEEARGRGLGLVVMDAVAERLRTLGCARWSLWVTDTNAPAIALYRRCEMTVSSSLDEIVMRPSLARALPEAADLSVESFGPEHDAAIERAFGLPEGRIARVRRLPGRTFLAARCDGATTGVLAFEPSSRSTPFLCATNASVARALLLALPGDEEVRLFLNDDVTLSGALISCGGRVLRHLLQMDGPLPR